MPGPPAILVAADVDGDRLRDLVVVVAYTEWDQIGVEQTTMDQTAGLVEVLTIVPALFDRRELHLFHGRSEGGFVAGRSMPLPPSVITLEAGPDGVPLIALTDEGAAELRFVAGAAAPFRLVPLLADAPALRGSGALVPALGLVRDWDGDGDGDLWLPGSNDAALYLAPSLRAAARAGSARAQPAMRVALRELPSRSGFEQPGLSRTLALPRSEDVVGDGVRDLVAQRDDGFDRLQVLRGRGGGRFAQPLFPLEGEPPERVAHVVHFGDLDGDGRAEYLVEEDLSDPDAGMRKEVKEAKRPPRRYLVHSAAGERLAPSAEPHARFDVLGYAFITDEDEDDGLAMPGGLMDLDADGRLDLVTVTLDFSVLQALRVLATQSLSLGIDFHVFCQQPGARFAPVAGLDLSGKFKLRLEDLRVRQLSQFAGDFDGDGRRDFLQIGRAGKGKQATVHYGRAGCEYPAQPDLVLALPEEPRNLALVRVADWDGDERADLLVIQPLAPAGDGETARVTLELSLSRGPRSTP